MRSKEYQNGQWRLAVGRPVFVKCGTAETRRLLAVLLNAGGAQAGETVLVDRELPRQEFVDGQGVAAARFFEGQQSAANGGDDFSLAANDPPLGAWGRQIRDGERAAVRQIGRAHV